EWTRAIRPLVVLFTAVNLFVTWRFQADVEAQGGAYATGVLVLMASACVAVGIDTYRTPPAWWGARLGDFLAVPGVFLYTTAANIYEKPDGIKIASWFILAIIASSVVSRLMRSTELRFAGFQFNDQHSRFLWASMQDAEFPVLVPHRPGTRSLLDKE